MELEAAVHPDWLLAVVCVHESPSAAAVAFDDGLAELDTEVARHLDNPLYKVR